MFLNKEGESGDETFTNENISPTTPDYTEHYKFSPIQTKLSAKLAGLAIGGSLGLPFLILIIIITIRVIKRKKRSFHKVEKSKRNTKNTRSSNTDYDNDYIYG